MKKNIVTQVIWSFKSFTTYGKNVTWNTEVKFTLTAFNNIPS